MNTFSHLEQLVDTFWRDIELATNVESPNPGDDLAIRAAIVGFSYNSLTSDWTKTHYDFVRERIEIDYDSSDLNEYGENGLNVKLYFSLAMGFLLGLYQKGLIDDEEFKIGEQQIPGLIMLHLPRLVERPV